MPVVPPEKCHLLQKAPLNSLCWRLDGGKCSHDEIKLAFSNVLYCMLVINITSMTCCSHQSCCCRSSVSHAWETVWTWQLGGCSNKSLFDEIKELMLPCFWGAQLPEEHFNYSTRAYRPVVFTQREPRPTGDTLWNMTEYRSIAVQDSVNSFSSAGLWLFDPEISVSSFTLWSPAPYGGFTSTHSM